MNRPFEHLGRSGLQRCARFALALTGAALLAAAIPAARAIELELVLAVDSSTSVDFREFNLQMRGYSAAFRDPRLVEIVATHPDGIAIALVLWSGPRQAVTAIEWTVLRDKASSNAFADRIDAMPRLVWGGSTAIAYAIEYAVRELEDNGVSARRMVIDISGDGKSNDGGLPLTQRNRAVAKGITINGLVILNEEPDIKEYYEKYVIGGADAFVEAVWTFEDFAEAILRKLVREIQGAPVSSALHAPSEKEIADAGR
ncbi:MAG: DUF1194 domain-containing protein [Alphaproteobacteria bacterium]|nr:DUF1194 domain-containing protein [Alphaproteobacteria bacterium]